MKTKMDKYKAYLGRFFKYWDEVTPQDIENFKKLNIAPDKSYLVIGSLSALNKFILLFLVHKYYRYEFHTLSDYVFDFENEESEILGAELLIIANYSDYSKSEKMKEFVLNSLCSTIVDRDVRGNQTVILSNFNIPEINTNCSEFIKEINLSDNFVSKTPKKKTSTEEGKCNV